jgi:hypothetical protein
LLKEVFAPTVIFDMSSLGGVPARKVAAGEICNMWQEGFQDIDAIHHQAGNYIVSIKESINAEVFCYATATHFKKNARKGNIREFVGTYDLALALTDEGWRVTGFRYNVKYVTGNQTLE